MGVDVLTFCTTRHPQALTKTEGFASVFQLVASACGEEMISSGQQTSSILLIYTSFVSGESLNLKDCAKCRRNTSMFYFLKGCRKKEHNGSLSLEENNALILVRSEIIKDPCVWCKPRSYNKSELWVLGWRL